MALARVSGGQSKGREPINYGPQKGTGQRGQYDAKREEYGNSPWYGRSGEATPMPWSGPPGQQRGQRAPFFTPDAGDPRNAGYYTPEPSAAQNAQWQGGQDTANAARQAAYGADPAISAARGAGDLRGYIQAMQQMKAQGNQQRFVDQGGTPETWQNRHDPNNNWPVPRAPSGNYQYGPGRPGPTPPNVAGGGPAPTGRMGGAGGITGYQASPAASTGGGETGGMYGSPMAAMMGRTPVGTFPGGSSPGGRPTTGPQPPPYTPVGPRPSPWGGGGGFSGGGNFQPYQQSPFQGQMPMDLMGGMQQFGYRPMGGGGMPQAGGGMLMQSLYGGGGGGYNPQAQMYGGGMPPWAMGY